MLSVEQLQNKGYTITFKKGECEIYDPEKKDQLQRQKMTQNRLFPIKIKFYKVVY